MKRYLSTLAVAAALLTAVSPPNAASARARQEDEGRDREVRVRMKDLPAAVQKTVREQSQGATIRGLSKETEHGKTNYEVELTAGGHSKDVLIDPSGAVVEVEEQVTLDSLPRAVRATIEQNARGGKLGLVESQTEGGTLVSYEAHVRKAGKSYEVKVGPDGKLISKGRG